MMLGTKAISFSFLGHNVQILSVFDSAARNIPMSLCESHLHRAEVAHTDNICTLCQSNSKTWFNITNYLYSTPLHETFR